MALRDQPYIPLYVQDFLTDEKLNECSAEAHGVYIKLMCLMHKSKFYGKILLRHLPRQNDRQILDFAGLFAAQLVKHLPFSLEIIKSGLTELLKEEVLVIDGDYLIQKRMVKDNSLSIKRASAGKKGAKKTNQIFAAANAASSVASNVEAKTAAKYEYENDIISLNDYLNMKRDINVVIQGIGSFNISVFDVAEPFQISELEKFICNSQKEFSVIAMTKPFVKQCENFKIALQHFVTVVQEKGAYKTKSELNSHFVNWLNTQNGSLKKIIESAKQKTSPEEMEQKRISQEEYLKG